MLWRYGHAGVAGSSPGYLNTPDDAYRLPNGTTTVADIQNCRVAFLRHSGAVARVLGGSCAHDPPRGFSSPNGATPLADGGLLVTEIGGWIDRLSANGGLLWSIRSPVPYPSDAQLLPNGRVLVASFSDPGRIVIVNRFGRVSWSFGASSGPDHLAKPSLAVRWPNGLIAANDDYNHRIIVVDPRTKRIVWQYGHTGVAGTAAGFLDKPDGLDLLPGEVAASAPREAPGPRRYPSEGSETCPSRPRGSPRSRFRAGGSSRSAGLSPATRPTRSCSALREPPRGWAGCRTRRTTQPPRSPERRRTSSAAGGSLEPCDHPDRPADGRARAAGTIGEPLSDLGAATVGGQDVPRRRLYRLALRNGGAPLPSRPAPALVTRLPAGLRYAGVAALDGKIYVAGGLTTSGDTGAVLAVDPARRAQSRMSRGCPTGGARRARTARVAPAARRRRLGADPLDRPAGSAP